MVLVEGPSEEEMERQRAAAEAKRVKESGTAFYSEMLAPLY